MMKTLVKVCLLICLAVSLPAHAQRTVVFKGKTYFVFDQTVSFYSYKITLDNSNLQLKENKLPPIIGSYKDGEYLIYDSYIKLKNCKEKGMNLTCDSFRKVYASFTILNGKKNGTASFYDYYSQKVYLTIPYVNDQIEGSFSVTGKYHFSYNSESFSMPNPEYRFNEPFDVHEPIGAFMNSHRIELNYKNGVPHGAQNLISIYKKKEYKNWELNFKEGLPDGSFVYHSYKKVKGKLCGFYNMKGQFLKGELDGKIEIEDLISKCLWYSIFRKGNLVYEESLSDKSKDRIVIVVGDTVKKIIDSKYKSQMMDHYELQQSSNHFFLMGYDQFVIFKEYASGKKDTVYKSANKVSRNYYNEFCYGVTVIDTNVLGQRAIKVLNLNTMPHYAFSEVVYSVDTSESKIAVYDKYVQTYLFRSKGLKCTFLYESYSSPRFRFYPRFSENFYELMQKNSSDSLNRLNLFYEREFKLYDFETINIRDWLTDTRFKGLKHTKDGKVVAALNYKRIIHNNQSYLISILELNNGNDQFILVDTLYCEKKRLNDMDPVLSIKYFNQIPGYVSLNDLNKLNNINYSFLHFLMPDKSRHTSMFYNGSPFSGKLKIEFDYISKSRIPKVAKSVLIDKYNNQKTDIIHIDLYLEKKLSKFTFQNTILPIENLHFWIKNGSFNGYFKAWDKWDEYAFDGQFIQNKLNGNFYVYCKRNYGNWVYKDIDLYRKIGENKNLRRLKHNKWYSNSDKLYYELGQLTDQANITNQCNPVYNSIALNIQNDVLKGHQIFYNSDYTKKIEAVYNAKDGFENSEFTFYDLNGLVTQSGSFVGGYLNGEYRDELENFKLKFEAGKKVDTGYYYNDDHILLYKCFNYKYRKETESDSFSFESIIGQYVDIEDYKLDNFWSLMFYPSLSQNTERLADTSDFIYYYSNGEIFSFGTKNKELPSGIWRFNRENASIYKSIDFHDTALNLKDTGKTYTYAYVTAYYPNGKIMYKGYSIEQSVIYSCGSQTTLPIDQIHYLEFYDSSGKSVLNNGNGFITELLPEGAKLREGNLLNFKKTGTWVEYDRFGMPTAIGRYENGMKVGRWLEGDLGGLSLPKNICFMDEEEFMLYVSREGKNLKLQEKFYSNGKLIQTNYFRTTKE